LKIQLLRSTASHRSHWQVAARHFVKWLRRTRLIPCEYQTRDRPPGKGSVFSEEAENGTFRPPVASKQTKQILNLKNLKNGLKLL